jgi:hypothetical protein
MCDIDLELESHSLLLHQSEREISGTYTLRESLAFEMDWI